MKPYTIVSMNWIKQLLGAAVVLIVLSPAAWAQNQARNTAGTNAAPSSAAAAAEEYIIGAEDVLSVNVWREAEISRTVTVRSDGKITLALVGEIQAGGLRPKDLEVSIKQKLVSGNFMPDPVVTVIVQEVHSRRFSILGNITRPGSYNFTSTMTIVDAIAVAGGFRDFAKQNSIYLLRQNSDGTRARLTFKYKDFMNGKNLAQNVSLRPNDTIIVP